MSATAVVPSVATLASRRGWQTLAQGLAVDVAVALAIVVAAYLPALGTWQDARLAWGVISFALAKSVVQAVVAWVIRRWFDRSGSSQPWPDGFVPERAEGVS